MDKIIEVLEKYGIEMIQPYNKEDINWTLDINEQWITGNKLELFKQRLDKEAVLLLVEKDKLINELRLDEKYKKIPLSCMIDFAFEAWIDIGVGGTYQKQVENAIFKIRTTTLNRSDITLRTLINEIYGDPEQFGVSKNEIKLVDMFGGESDKVQKIAEETMFLYKDFVYDKKLKEGLEEIVKQIKKALIEEESTNEKLKEILT